MPQTGLTLEQVEAGIAAISEEAKQSALAGDDAFTERVLLRKLTLEFMRDVMKQGAEERASSEAKRTAGAQTHYAISLDLEQRVKQFKQEIFAIKARLGPEGPYAEIARLEEVEERVTRENALSDLRGQPHSISRKDKAQVDRLQELRVLYGQEAEQLARLQAGLRDLLLSPAAGMAEQRVEELKQEIAATETRLGPGGRYAEIPRLEAIEQSVARDSEYRVREGLPQKSISPKDKALLDTLQELRVPYKQELERLAKLRSALRDAELFLPPAKLSSR